MAPRRGVGRSGPTGPNRRYPARVAAPIIGLTSTPTLTDGHSGPQERMLVEAVERAYVDAVVGAGGVPMVLPVLDPAAAGDVLDRIDGLLLTGGPDVDPDVYGAEPEPEVYGVDPARDAWELALARSTGVPILGICRGAQLINVSRGGTLVQHLPDRTVVEHRVVDRPGHEIHAVEVDGGSNLHDILGTGFVAVNSLHHQAVDEVGAGLVVTARSEDGTVECIEAQDGPVIGVQWHPELLVAHGSHRRIFNWLVTQAAIRRADLEVSSPRR